MANVEKMNRPQEPSREEIELFRRTIGPIKRLDSEHGIPDKPRLEPLPEQRRLEERKVLEESLTGDYDSSEIETGEELLYVRPGVDRGVIRKLRRGQYSIEAQLDLHGMTVPVAKAAVSNFLQVCLTGGKRCLIIIHGKGHGSFQRQPILKGQLNVWLQKRAEVLAFCSTRPVDGGTGSVYVLLKRG
jgi:DNA-nicking Smr family endonuclease